MMAGLPVIASSFPEMTRVIRENDSGILVDPESPREIASAILRLARDPGEAGGMGARGREAVLERYNWKVQEAVLLELYRELAGE